MTGHALCLLNEVQLGNINFKQPEEFVAAVANKSFTEAANESEYSQIAFSMARLTEAYISTSLALSKMPPTISVNQCTPDTSLPNTINAAKARVIIWMTVLVYGSSPSYGIAS